MLNIKNSPHHWRPIWQLYEDPLTTFTQIMRAKGDLVRIRTPFSFYLVNDANLIAHILDTSNQYFGKNTLDYRLFNRFLAKGVVSTEGELWHKVSGLSHPHFSQTYNQQLLQAIQQGLAWTLANWSVYAEQGVEIDLGHEVARLCFQIACQILFAVPPDDFAVADYLEHVNIPAFDGIALLLKYIPSQGNRAHQKFHRQFEQLIMQLGAKALKQKTPCLFTSLAKSLSKKQLMREMKVFVFGSHATLANLLTWIFYTIARNPDYDAQVATEVCQVNTDCTDCRFISALPFTGALINEVKRLYPPVWMISRNCKITHEFEDYFIPKGSSFFIVPWTLHRNVRYWQNPDEFDPNRFMQVGGYNKKAFLPFSQGPRKCMGKRLAVMELFLIVLQLLKTFKMTVQNTETIGVVNCISPKPSSRIKVTLAYRDKPMQVDQQNHVAARQEVV